MTKELKYPPTSNIDGVIEHYASYNQTTGRKIKEKLYNDGCYVGEIHYHDNGNRTRELVFPMSSEDYDEERIYDPQTNIHLKSIIYYDYDNKKIRAEVIYQQLPYEIQRLKQTNYREKEQTRASVWEYTTIHDADYQDWGKLKKETNYYINGEDISSILEYDYEFNEKQKIYYNPDGSIKEIIPYQDGKPIIPDGEQITYYDTNHTQIHQICEYKNQRLITKTIYLPDGTLHTKLHLKSNPYSNIDILDPTNKKIGYLIPETPNADK
ncbi:hypothetical protein [Candidatus Phytoplasma pruni]|uniref:DUF2963 domain-containing protein n=1 Tax=Candidatus Phytoplasma pruni TaxID=479893 RepID=A0A851HGY6_9MOLU|nr:hypothetical protein [Candidatus Phytoplasma pruni]NWN45880.1 hypothetical protein [Candidatus Phytoplasma pruni]